ncbi:hypothetical protein [Streptomyces sp. NBC_01565]|uniref:hypothetical protein n=1 Tax=unclassified Streptomyces TaxID=2593676 RepID=UPI0022558314|nr:hypothetical protein [Streptomyces sp. NBC_01565]MCX4546550.1 hypothetical protein [Streptomyces sp. NBC_01565]
MTRRAGQRAGSASAPYALGHVVRGLEALSAGERRQPEIYAGVVVQVGSGWDGVDADNAYLWVRLPDGTERRLAIRDCALVPPAGRASS